MDADSWPKVFLVQHFLLPYLVTCLFLLLPFPGLGKGMEPGGEGSDELSYLVQLDHTTLLHTISSVSSPFPFLIQEKQQWRQVERMEMPILRLHTSVSLMDWLALCGWLVANLGNVVKMWKWSLVFLVILLLGFWGLLVLLSQATASKAPMAAHFFWAEFKVLLLTFKVLYGSGSGYLRDHLHPYNPTCHLRSWGGPADGAATKRGRRVWWPGAGPSWWLYSILELPSPGIENFTEFFSGLFYCTKVQ